MTITTEQGALDAVLQDGWALRDVPDGLRTPAVCLDAVLQDGKAIQFVPEALKTAELCL